jgi:radical SAM protein with 4Fe4S-binding SPASM domain
MMNIDSYGNVLPCIMHFEDEEYRYGNIYQESIETIWNNRHKIINKINASKLSGCREVCRLDEMNLYLNELKNPGEHVNFI